MKYVLRRFLSFDNKPAEPFYWNAWRGCWERDCRDATLYDQLDAERCANDLSEDCGETVAPIWRGAIHAAV